MKQTAASSFGLSVAPDDYDTLDWSRMLRESVLKAYVGIVSGLRDGAKQEMLLQYICLLYTSDAADD